MINNASVAGFFTGCAPNIYSACKAAVVSRTDSVATPAGTTNQLATNSGPSFGKTNPCHARVSLRARDENGPAIRFQVMVYPVLDHDYENGSYKQFGENWGVITRNDMTSSHRQYVSHSNQLDLSYVSLCRCTDLSRLPKALIILAEADPLRDEALDKH